MTREIISIPNKHGESCGEPPKLEFGDYDYVSYFENEYGEQSFFLYNSENGVIYVFMGDIEWENRKEIPIEDVLQPENSQLESEYILNEAERDWLLACKKAIMPRIE